MVKCNKKSKRIWLNFPHKKYCQVILYEKKFEMQKDYARYSPQDGNHYKTLGVHHGFDKLIIEPGKKAKLSPQTGIVRLCLEHCGAGVVSHEFMHAVLWANGHKRYKKQYPIVIKNMKEEEKILHNLTYAVRQFYEWYWKVTNRKGNKFVV